MAAVEVTAPMAPVVVNGFRFKAKPEAEVVPVAVLVVAAVVPGTFNPKPSVPRGAVPVEPVEVAPSERPVVVVEVEAEEVATDANKEGPVEPSTEVVLVVEAVVAAVDATPSLVPKDRVGAWLVLVVSVAVVVLVAAVEGSAAKVRPVGCPPRLKGAAAGVAAPRVAVLVVAAAAGAVPKVSPADVACGAAVPMPKPAVPA